MRNAYFDACPCNELSFVIVHDRSLWCFVCPCVTAYFLILIACLTVRRRSLEMTVPERRGGSDALADSSDFGLLWSKVHKSGRFLAVDADKPPCEI